MSDAAHARTHIHKYIHTHKHTQAHIHIDTHTHSPAAATRVLSRPRLPVSNFSVPGSFVASAPLFVCPRVSPCGVRVRGARCPVALSTPLPGACSLYPGTGCTRVPEQASWNPMSHEVLSTFISPEVSSCEVEETADLVQRIAVSL